MGKIKVLNVLVRFNKLIVSLVVLVAFFSSYNIFLIDRTLESLSFALEQTALAYDIEDTAGLEIVLAQAAAEEIFPQKLNSMNIANLEYAESIMTTGKNYKQLDYAQVSLRTLIKEKERKRGFILTILDRINRPVRKGFIYAANLPRAVFRPRIARAAGEETAVTLFEKISILEKEGALQSAVLNYETFIEKYTGDENIPLVMLRLGYAYQRLGQYDKAGIVYKKLVGVYYPKREAQTAQILMDSLKQKDKLLNQANLLIIAADELPDSEIDAKQEIFYQLGIIYAKLFNFEDARRFFNRVVKLNPSTDLAVKSQFNAAWMNKQQFKLEESLNEFSRILEEHPTSDLVLDSRYQLADVYHAQGKYEEAIGVYEEMVRDYKDEPIAPLCLFQTGASYIYDLNDTEAGSRIIGRLTKEYADSPYAEYFAPDNPVGIFLTYLVPRATRVVAWRAGGLLCLSGFSGEIVKFKVKAEEEGLNSGFNRWLKTELPDTVGNLWVDIKGTEIKLKKGKAVGSGRITMGKFNVDAKAEGHLEITEENSIALAITKATLKNIPIPPLFINRTVAGLSLIARKYFPLTVTRISFDEGEVSIEGYGSKRIINRVKESCKKLLGVEVKIEDITDPEEKRNIYEHYNGKFPESEFTPSPTYDSKSLFYDFFSRMSLFSTFVLLETVKDSKLDYERSVRTLGRLMVKKERFRVTYTEADINTSLNIYISNEFPWLINNKFLFDVKGMELYFKDNGEIRFESYLRLGCGDFPIETSAIKVEGRFTLEIDEGSGIPRIVFKEVLLNGEAYPVEKLNLVTLLCLNILKDMRIPFKLDEVKVYEGGIALKGEGAKDFTARVFSEPHLFVIFQIRAWDLPVAGVERLQRQEKDGTYWRGRGREEMLIDVEDRTDLPGHMSNQ